MSLLDAASFGGFAALHKFLNLTLTHELVSPILEPMTLPLPGLNGLRAFEAAARHLSFTRAADELHVTQTAISHQIRKLEDQLGVKLFLRRIRAVELTREGEEYLPSVRAAFEDLRQATARLRGPRAHAVVTVSTTTSLAAKWLLPKLADFQAQYPNIEIRLTTTTALIDLAGEGIDLGIRYGRGAWPGLQADWLMAEDIFPVCSPTLLTGPKPLARPEDLAQHTLLHMSLYADEWQHWLTAAGLPARLATGPGLTFDLSLMALAAAMDGLGVALGRTAYVEADLAAGRLVKPFDFVLPAEAGFYVVTPQGTAPRSEVASFIAWLHGTAAPGG